MSSPSADRDLAKALKRLAVLCRGKATARPLEHRTLLPSLQDLLRTVEAEDPALAMESSFDALEALTQALDEDRDPDYAFSRAVPEFLAYITQILTREQSSEEPAVNCAAGFDRLVCAFAADGSGHYSAVQEFLLAQRDVKGLSEFLFRRLQEELHKRPLPFPASAGAEWDPYRLALWHERHGLERLIGEWLARSGQHDYAIAVARARDAMTRDGTDLVRALARAERFAEALEVAETRLADPKTTQRAAYLELVDQLEGIQGPAEIDREARRKSERAFLEAPTRSRLDALRRRVDPGHWPHYFRGILRHLVRHRLAPDLAFLGWLELGDVLEADALVVTQPIPPDLLKNGADQIRDRHPEPAAGWLLIAILRRAESTAPREEAALLRDLRTLCLMSVQAGQQSSLLRALEPLWEKLAGREEVLKAARALLPVETGPTDQIHSGR